MKSEDPTSSPANPPKFDFPSWPENSASTPQFVLPNFQVAEARERVAVDSGGNNRNPFYADAVISTMLNSTEEETPPLSPFGIPLSSLNPAPAPRREILQLFLSFSAKTAVVCLLVVIGWVGYGEYATAGSSSEMLAKWRSSAAAWFLSEDASDNDSVTKATVFVAEALVPTLEIAVPESPAKQDEERMLREELAKNATNADLLISLADNLARQGKKDEAWLLLAKSTRTGDQRFGSRLLSLGLETGKHDETLLILDPEAPGAPEWDNKDWITIALLYEKSGNTAHALKLLKIHDKEKIHANRIVAQDEQSSKTGKPSKAAALN